MSPGQRARGGFALLPVVLALALLAATAYLMTREGAMGGSLVASAQQADRARYVAEAALQHASWQVQTSDCSGFSDVSDTSFGSNGEHYSATVSPTSGSPVTLTATGTLADGTSHTIKRSGVAAYEFPPPPLLLQPGPEGIDTGIGSGSQQHKNYGADDTLYFKIGGVDRRALLRFDLTSVPAGARILEARLGLFSDGSGQIANGVIDAHRVTRTWFEGVDIGSIPWQPGATYVMYDGAGFGTYWDTPGGDYDPVPVDSLTIPSLVPGWYEWDVTALAEGGAQSALATHGVLLRASGGDVDDAQFMSSDAGEPGRPKLTITYACECGTVCEAPQDSAASLWLSTLADVASSGAPGLDSWAKEDVIAFADPNLVLEPGVTSGTFSLALNLSSFAADASVQIDAIHYVANDVTVGGANSVDLLAGDVLLSTGDPETLDSLAVNPEDVIVFRPGAPGDYGSGTFIFLIDGSQIVDGSIVGISLVEQATTVGDGLLAQGSFLLALTNRRDVLEFTAADVGPGTTAGAVNEYIDGPSLGFGSEIRGIELAENALTIGGHAVAAGSILLTLRNDDTDGVADNALPADSADVFYLTVTQVGASPVADATLLFEGSDVNLDTVDEQLDALSLVGSPAGAGGGTRVLYVVKDPDAPSAQESAREGWMADWGFNVTLFDDDETQTRFDDAAADNDVAYVSQEALEGSLGTKLAGAAIGVVNESRDLIDVFGFAASANAGGGLPTLNVDPSHYITSVFPTAIVAPYTVNEWYQISSTPVATGAQPVGAWVESPWTDLPALMALETGADLFGGGTAAGRRVQIPMGAGQGLAPVDIEGLSDDGRTLIRRSIQWAAGAGLPAGPQTVLLVVGADPPPPSSKDEGLVALIESFGYDVSLIDDGESQANFDAAAAAADVVYVSGSVVGGALLDKLTGTTTPVVNEFPGKLDNFGFCSVTTDSFSADTFTKSDAAHYISSPFGGGAINVLTTFLMMPVPSGTLAPDLQVPAGFAASELAVVTLDTGAKRWDGNPAPARRVHLPFAPAQASQLTGDGEIIVQRAIEWAAGTGAGGGDKPPTEPPSLGGGSVNYEGFADVNPSTTYNVLVPTPAGTVEGDLLIAAIASDEDATDLAAPAGWSSIALQANGTRATLGVWWKLAGASEPATHPFTSSRYEMKYGWMMRFSGHDPANPINATSSFDTGSSKNPPVPSTTTTVDNTLILRIGGFDHEDITVGDPGLAGHTPITMALGGSGLGACAGGAGYTVLSTAGATGTAEFVLTAREEYVTGTIAIAPDPN